MKLLFSLLCALFFSGCLLRPSLDPQIPANKQCFLMFTPGSLKSQSYCALLRSKDKCDSQTRCVWSGNDPWGRPTEKYRPCWNASVRSCEEEAANRGCLRVVAGQGSPKAIPAGAVYAPCGNGRIGPWYQRTASPPNYVAITGPGSGK